MCPVVANLCGICLSGVRKLLLKCYSNENSRTALPCTSGGNRRHATYLRPRAPPTPNGAPGSCVSVFFPPPAMTNPDGRLGENKGGTPKKKGLPQIGSQKNSLKRTYPLHEVPSSTAHTPKRPKRPTPLTPTARTFLRFGNRPFPGLSPQWARDMSFLSGFPCISQFFLIHPACVRKSCFPLFGNTATFFSLTREDTISFRVTYTVTDSILCRL